MKFYQNLPHHGRRTERLNEVGYLFRMRYIFCIMQLIFDFCTFNLTKNKNQAYEIIRRQNRTRYWCI